MKFFSFFDSTLALVITILGFGVCFIILTPPFQTPDEPAHFYRAWQIATLKREFTEEGYNTGCLLPVSLGTLEKAARRDIPFNPDRKIPEGYFQSLVDISLSTEIERYISFPNTAVNSFLLYLPQSTAIFLTRLVQAPPVFGIYFGRFLNLIFWCFLVVTAIRLCPHAKWLIVPIALMPMSLFQAASLSADATFNAASLCFIAYVLNAMTRDDKIRLPEQAVMIGLALLLLVGKQGYFPLTLLIFFIPARRFHKRSQRHLFNFVCIILFAIVFSVQFHRVSGIRHYVTGVSHHAQIAYIFSEPIRYASTMISTLMRKRCFYATSFVGNFGWMDTPLPFNLVCLYLVFLSACGLTGWRSRVFPGLRQKIAFFITATLNITVVMTALYVSWTPVGKPTIIGVQGRYFIPFALLGLLVFINRRFARISSLKTYPFFVLLFIQATLVFSLCKIHDRYYAGFFMQGIHSSDVNKKESGVEPARKIKHFRNQQLMQTAGEVASGE